MPRPSAVAGLGLLCCLVLLGVVAPLRGPDAGQLAELRRAKSEAARLREEVDALAAERDALRGAAQAAGARKLQQADASVPPPPPTPRPPSYDELLRRVKQTPQCLEAVRGSIVGNAYSSQYSQDWFVVMNYFHHLPKGFYLDIGANQPKQLSNTWFLDVCLGWEGVCVEASPALAADLRKKRSCKVVNACVDNRKRTMALRAAGTEIGTVVSQSDAANAQVIECTTFKDIVDSHNIRHIDFMSLDVENYEPNVLATFPEEEDGVEIDVILIENEKTSHVAGKCHRSNLLRFPFWNRGYALVDFFGGPQGDDLWVKLGRPHLWRDQLLYPRSNKLTERTRATAYKLRPRLYTDEIRDKLLAKDV